MWSYRSRLERDLARWRQRGWISDSGFEEIRRDLDARSGGISLSSTLAVLGAVLIGFAGGHVDGSASGPELVPRDHQLGLLYAIRGDDEHFGVLDFHDASPCVLVTSCVPTQAMPSSCQDKITQPGAARWPLEKCETISDG